MVTDSTALSQGPHKAVVFDLDGTLVDTQGDFLVVLQRTLVDLNCHPVERARVDAAFIREVIGKGSEDLIRNSLAHAWGLPTDDAEIDAAWPQAWASYQTHYREVNGQHAQVFEGVRPALNALCERDVPLACLTNKPTQLAEQLLQVKGLRDRFRHVYGGDAFAHKKPHPEPLIRTSQALGAMPQEVLMVGDSRNDAQAAAAAGCPVLLVRYGYNHGQPIDEVPALCHVDRLDAVDWPRLLGW